MEVQDLERMIREKENVISLAFPALMRKVYVWMSLALVITGVTAYGVANSPSLMTAIYSSRMTFWILIIAQLALVIGVTRAIDRLSLTSATLLFILNRAHTLYVTHWTYHCNSGQSVPAQFGIRHDSELRRCCNLHRTHRLGLAKNQTYAGPMRQYR